MKIGFVLDDNLDRPDGVQQAVINIAEWFRTKGHDVHYLVGRTERSDLVNVHSLARSLKVKFNGNTMTTPLPTSSALLKKFLVEEKFDVLHVQMPYSPFFAAKVVKFAPKKTKIIGTFHILPYGRVSTVATKQLGRMLKRSLKRFDHFISVSEPAAKFAKASFGIDSSVIPNPVRTEPFIAVRREHNNSIKRFVFLGRLEERKGVVELVKAYALLLKDNPDLIKKTQLIIGGKGPLKDRVHSMIIDLPRGASAELLGFVPEQDKPELFASADVAVLPSTSGESFGIVLVEAMAAGSGLILAGNNPGYASVIGDKTELLVNSRNTEEFAAKLKWSLTRTDETKELGKWLRNEASRYDIERVAGQLLELYQR